MEDILRDIRLGKPVVVVDDPSRENEGDLTIAAQCATPENIGFMIREGRGLVCLSVTEARAHALGLTMQVVDNQSPFHTNFTLSIDHKSVLGSNVYGSAVSAESRAFTIRAAVDEAATACDFVSPGHVFPLRAVNGGVLRRRGQTEASVDLARLAGLAPAGVICEIMGADGTMLRGQHLTEYCEKHSLLMTSVEEIVQYRLRNEVVMRRVAEYQVSVEDALGVSPKSISVNAPSHINVYVYSDDVDSSEHLAFAVGDLVNAQEDQRGSQRGILVRIHSECLTGDVFGSRRCDCGWQFREALRSVVGEGCGLVIYLMQEGRGIGLSNKVKAYALQDQGADTVDANLALGFEADLRNYRQAANILFDCNVSRVRLLTNNPAKVASLESYGIRVEERVEHAGGMNEHNSEYLLTKERKLGHIITDSDNATSVNGDS